MPIEESEKMFQEPINPVGNVAELFAGVGGFRIGLARAGWKTIFSNQWVVLGYVLGVVALFWHLFHGFQSAFQTFGVHHKKYSPIIKTLGTVYALVICTLFALMPIAMYLNWVI